MQAHPEPKPAPICANCGSSMSDREENRWFCPNCTAYDRNLPTIYPWQPGHPAYYKMINDDPRMLEGQAVCHASYGQTDPEFVGVVTSVEDETVVEIVAEDDGVFEEIVRLISLERFLDLLHEVQDPVRPDPLPEDKEVFVLE